LQRDVLPSPKRSFGVALADRAPAPPRGNAYDPRNMGRLQARDSDERDAYDRDADTQDADSRNADERDDFDRDGTEARDDDSADNGAPPRYADAAPPRTTNRGDDGADDNTDDNSGERGGYGANDAPGADAYNAPYDGGSSAHPRMVRGRDGHWYLLLNDDR
jgi:hypothetical protein